MSLVCIQQSKDFNLVFQIATSNAGVTTLE